MTALPRLRHRLAIEQKNAQQATCQARRQEHEDHVRAYAKLIAVFERERHDAASRRVG